MLDGTLVNTLMQAWRDAHQGNHGDYSIGTPDTQVAVLLKLDVVLEVVPPSIKLMKRCIIEPTPREET